MRHEPHIPLLSPRREMSPQECAALPNFPKIEAEARKDRIAADDRGAVDALRGLAGLVNDGAVVDGVEQPSQSRAVGDVFVHFRFKVAQAVRWRAHLDDEVRT